MLSLRSTPRKCEYKQVIWKCEQRKIYLITVMIKSLSKSIIDICFTVVSHHTISCLYFFFINLCGFNSIILHKYEAHHRKCTWACLNIPGWYSSNQSTFQTNREPSMGWILNNMSAPLFHSSNSTSTWCATAARGSSPPSGPRGSVGLFPLSSSSELSSSSGSGWRMQITVFK